MKKDLPDWIRERGLKLPAFAALIGIPYQTVYGYLRSGKPLNSDFLCRAAKALKIEVEEILDPAVEVLNDRPATEYGESSILRVLGDDEMWRLFKAKSAEAEEARGERRIVLLAAIEQMAREMARREKEK